MYNLTHCCNNVLISPGCMPLCDYNARMTHVQSLTVTCIPEISRIMRCQVTPLLIFVQFFAKLLITKEILFHLLRLIYLCARA